MNETTPDLLRRAAKLLRDHVEPFHALNRWRPTEFGVYLPDGRSVVEDHCPFDTAITVHQYIALMHPPVAVAMADLLEAHAQRGTEVMSTMASSTIAERVMAEEPGYAAATTLARAILREEAK